MCVYHRPVHSPGWTVTWQFFSFFFPCRRLFCGVLVCVSKSWRPTNYNDILYLVVTYMYMYLYTTRTYTLWWHNMYMYLYTTRTYTLWWHNVHVIIHHIYLTVKYNMYMYLHIIHWIHMIYIINDDNFCDKDVYLHVTDTHNYETLHACRVIT